MRNRKEKTEFILALGAELDKTKDLDLLLEKILYNARLVTNADAGSIYLVKDEKFLTIHCSQNETIESRYPENQKLPYVNVTFPMGVSTISGYVALQNIMLNIPDMYQIPANKPYSFKPDYDVKNNYKTVSSLTFPLRAGNGKVLGVLQLLNAKQKKKIIPFSKDLEPYVQLFANIAANALQQAQLTRSLIYRMIVMSAMRDPKETATHANRIGAYSAEIYECWAKKHNVTPELIEKNKDILRIAAMLHDIGKVGISDVILKKPGRFTPEERAIMERHSFLGYQIFDSALTEYDEIARDIALRHHENWDGTGYPGHIDLKTGEAIGGVRVGLKGTEISLFARIVSICDVFDALSEARVYKEAWTEESVLEEIRKMSGVKFDPELVDIFFEVYDNIKNLKQRYQEQR